MICSASCLFYERNKTANAHYLPLKICWDTHWMVSYFDAATDKTITRLNTVFFFRKCKSYRADTPISFTLLLLLLLLLIMLHVSETVLHCVRLVVVYFIFRSVLQLVCARAWASVRERVQASKRCIGLAGTQRVHIKHRSIRLFEHAERASCRAAAMTVFLSFDVSSFIWHI